MRELPIAMCFFSQMVMVRCGQDYKYEYVIAMAKDVTWYKWSIFIFLEEVCAMDSKLNQS